LMFLIETSPSSSRNVCQVFHLTRYAVNELTFYFRKKWFNLLSNFKQSLIFILTQSKLLLTTVWGTVRTKPLRMCGFLKQLLLLATLIKLYKLLKNSRLIK